MPCCRGRAARYNRRTQGRRAAFAKRFEIIFGRKLRRGAGIGVNIELALVWRILRRQIDDRTPRTNIPRLD